MLAQARWQRPSIAVPPKFLIAVCIGILAVVAGYAVSRAPWNPVLYLAAANAIVVWVPIAIQVKSRTFDALAPFLTFAVTWSVMFVARPLENLSNGDTTLRGRYEVGDAYPAALVLALVGAFAFVIGYFSPHFQNLQRFTSRPSQLGMETSTLAFFAMVLSVPAFALLAIQFGSKLGGSTAYLYFAPLVLIGSSLMFLALGMTGKRLYSIVGIMLLAVFSLNFLIVGQRFFVLLAAASVFIFFATYSGKRIGLPRLLGYAVVLLFGFLGPLVTWRSEEATELSVGDRLQHTIKSISTSWEEFIAGASNEMLPALALQISTREQFWNYSPGYLPLQIVGHWIPRSLWPSKNVSVPELLYREYFPEHYAEARANAQFSILREFFCDSGLLGVIVGMLLYGLFARWAWQAYLRNQDKLVSHLLYAPFLPVLLIVLRGDSALILSLAFFIYMPLLAAKAWSVLFEKRLR